MTDRHKYMQQFKDDAVELVVSSGPPISKVCLDSGVLEGTLGNWVCKHREDPERFTTGQEKAPAANYPIARLFRTLKGSPASFYRWRNPTGPLPAGRPAPAVGS